MQAQKPLNGQIALVFGDTISTLHRRDAFSASSRRSMKQMSTQCRQPLLAAY